MERIGSILEFVTQMLQILNSCLKYLKANVIIIKKFGYKHTGEAHKLLKLWKILKVFSKPSYMRICTG